MPTSPADRHLIRALNRSTVLNVIRESGPVSKADVARETGLSQATVGAITRTLIDHRLVTESEPTASGVGRPPILLQLDRDSYNVIGLKLMSDHIVGAVSDLEANTIAQAELDVAEVTPGAIVEAAGQLVSQLLDLAGLGRQQLLGVGIGMGGVIDTYRGVCISSPFLGWSDVPIGRLAEKRFGVPVRVDNDVNTLALAERWFGIGQKVDDFLLVTLGRGVGLSMVTGGRLYRGSQGGAGEFGHTVTGNSSEVCICGNEGCLEAAIAEPALVRRANLVVEGQELSSPADLYEMALTQPLLAELLAEAGHELGRALGNLVNLFAPALVILSGEGVEAGELLLEPAREELKRHVHLGLRDSYQLVIEPLRDEAWARGAASLVLDAVFDPPNHPHAVPMWDWDLTTRPRQQTNQRT